MPSSAAGAETGSEAAFGIASAAGAETGSEAAFGIASAAGAETVSEAAFRVAREFFLALLITSNTENIYEKSYHAWLSMHSIPVA
jgi:hypothetical protein